MPIACRSRSTSTNKKRDKTLRQNLQSNRSWLYSADVEVSAAILSALNSTRHFPRLTSTWFISEESLPLRDTGRAATCTPPFLLLSGFLSRLFSRRANLVRLISPFACAKLCIHGVSRNAVALLRMSKLANR